MSLQGRNNKCCGELGKSYDSASFSGKQGVAVKTDITYVALVLIILLSVVNVSAQADIKPLVGELRGNYRLYVWQNRADHEEIAEPSNDSDRGSGFGVSIDQQAIGYLTIFARIGFQDKDLYEFDTA